MNATHNFAWTPICAKIRGLDGLPYEAVVAVVVSEVVLEKSGARTYVKPRVFVIDRMAADLRLLNKPWAANAIDSFRKCVQGMDRMAYHYFWSLRLSFDCSRFGAKNMFTTGQSGQIENVPLTTSVQEARRLIAQAVFQAELDRLDINSNKQQAQTPAELIALIFFPNTAIRPSAHVRTYPAGHQR